VNEVPRTYVIETDRGQYFLIRACSELYIQLMWNFNYYPYPGNIKRISWRSK
jgi:hypothetical protein